MTSELRGAARVKGSLCSAENWIWNTNPQRSRASLRNLEDVLVGFYFLQTIHLCCLHCCQYFRFDSLTLSRIISFLDLFMFWFFWWNYLQSLHSNWIDQFAKIRYQLLDYQFLIYLYYLVIPQCLLPQYCGKPICSYVSFRVLSLNYKTPKQYIWWQKLNII